MDKQLPVTLVTELCASRIGRRIKLGGEINSRKYDIYLARQINISWSKQFHGAE